MSITVRAAQAVTDYIAELCPAVQVQRSYLPVAELETLEDMDSALVYVIPVDSESERITQGNSRKHTLAFDIAVNKKLRRIGTDGVTAEIDELIEIGETVYNEFLKKVHIAADGFRLTADQPEYLLLSDYESIQLRNCFLAAVRISVNVYEIQKTAADASVPLPILPTSYTLLSTP